MADPDQSESVFEFLAEFSWIHSYPVVNYFTDQIGENIPVEWREFLASLTTEELNMIPFQSPQQQANWPTSFCSFVEKCQRFSLDRTQIDIETPVFIGQDLRRGMSPKKLHEVKNMAAMVNKLCGESETDIVVDVGSGLGYLGEVLHKCYGYPVIGIEGSDGHVQRAEKRSARQGLSPDCVKTINFRMQPGIENLKELTAKLRHSLNTIQPCCHGTGKMTQQLKLIHIPSDGSKLDFKQYQHSEAEQLTKRDHSEKYGKADVSEKLLCETSSKCHNCSSCGSSIQSTAFDKDCDSLKWDKSSDNQKLCCETHSQRHIYSSCESLIKSTTLDKVVDSVKWDKSKDNEKLVCETLSESHICSSGLSPDCVKTINFRMQPGIENLKELTATLRHSLTTIQPCCHDTGKTTRQLKLIHRPSDGSKLDFKQYQHSETEKLTKCDISEKDGKADVSKKLLCETSTKCHVCSVCETQTKCSTSVHCSNSEDSGFAFDEKLQCENQDDSKHDSSKDENSTESFCLVGLHCCGDLTVTSLDYFLKLTSARILCLVSCCYHKMASDADSIFNFPLSTLWNSSYKKVQKLYPGCRVNSTSLRLAAQETRSRWKTQTVENHALHTNNVGFRALLELFLKEAGRTDWIKNVFTQKKIRKADYSTFQLFVSSLLPKEDDDGVARWCEEQLGDLNTRLKHQFKHIEAFTCLQVLLQPVLESVVYLDRQQWLREHGIHVRIVPVFDDQISPRSLALIAIK